MAAQRFLNLVGNKVVQIVASVLGTPNAIPSGDANGKLDLSWMPTGLGPETKTAVASEALVAGNFVNLYLNAGVLTARKANATNNTRPAKGFVIANVSIAGTATVYLLSQINTALSGLTVGAEYYLSSLTAGAITTSPTNNPGNILQYLGTALSATELDYSNETYVELS